MIDPSNRFVLVKLLYFKVSGRVIPLYIRKKAIGIAIGLPILSSLSVIITHVTMVDFRLMQVKYIYIFFLFSLIW